MRYVMQHVMGQREDLVAAVRLVLPELEIVACDGDSRVTFLRSLRAAGCDGFWHLEDDVILCPDFHERTSALPRDNVFISGFDRRGDWRRGTVQMPPSAFLFNLCLYFPPGTGIECAAFGEAYQGWEPPGGFDLCVRAWLMATRRHYLLVRPSLVEHAACRSLLGPRSRRRQSSSFGRVL